ncbi:hypothetical protein TNCV_3840471 [Trichonephila clavipes]|nr:hypothetical protein TNCV_3840471 [Trichonephila clavipes]
MLRFEIYHSASAKETDSRRGVHTVPGARPFLGVLGRIRRPWRDLFFKEGEMWHDVNCNQLKTTVTGSGGLESNNTCKSSQSEKLYFRKFSNVTKICEVEIY